MYSKLASSRKTPHQGRFLLAGAFSVLGVLALAGAWLAPNHYPPWTSFHGEAAAFASLVLFALARLAAPQQLVAARAAWLSAAVIALIAVQFLAGQIAYAGDALLSALYVAGWGLAWWLGMNSRALGTKSDPLVAFAWIVIVVAAVSVGLGILQWLRMEAVIGVFAAERGLDMRVYSNLGQPNHLASLVMMASALTFLLFTTGRLGRVGCVALIAWFAWGLTLSESRSGLLSAFCMGALIVGKSRKDTALPKGRWIGAWLVGISLLAAAWPAINQALYLQSQRGALAAADSPRQLIWKQSLSGIAASPWVGYGWRQSMVGQKAGAATIKGAQASDYAHNVVLDACLWVGIPLGLLLAGGAMWWLFRMLARTRGPVEVLLFASLVPLLVHSMFEFPFAYSYFLFPGTWALALLARMQHERSTGAVPMPARASTRPWLGVAVLAFGLTLFAAAREYLEAEEDHRVMRFEMRRVGRTPEGYEQPHLVLLTQLHEMLVAGRIVPREHMPPEEIERLRVGSVRFAWATLHLSYAMALAMNGEPRLAEHELRLLRATYGDDSYATARLLWHDMQSRHPEMSAVTLP